MKVTKLLLLITTGNFSFSVKMGASVSIGGSWYQSCIYFYKPQEYAAISRGNTN